MLEKEDINLRRFLRGLSIFPIFLKTKENEVRGSTGHIVI